MDTWQQENQSLQLIFGIKGKKAKHFVEKNCGCDITNKFVKTLKYLEVA